MNFYKVRVLSAKRISHEGEPQVLIQRGREEDPFCAALFVFCTRNLQKFDERWRRKLVESIALFKRDDYTAARALRRQVGTHRTDRRFRVTVPAARLAPLIDLIDFERATSLLMRANAQGPLPAPDVQGPRARHIKISDPIELLGNDARYRDTANCSSNRATATAPEAGPANQRCANAR